MSTDTSTSLQLTRVIKAPRERVFAAWTEPSIMTQWSAPEGYLVQEAEVDLRVDGAFRVRMESPEGETHTAEGVYREVEPPRRLVYTWTWAEGDAGMGETVVTVEFRDLDDATAVVLTHEGFPDAAAREDHEQGWASCLNRLEGVFG
jgi:glutathione S-transferase